MPAGDDIDEKLRMFGEIDHFVKVKICGKEYDVPGDMELLRCYQYLDFKMAFENFCWNGNCENCSAKMSLAGEEAETHLSCQTLSADGIEVKELPEDVKETD